MAMISQREPTFTLSSLLFAIYDSAAEMECDTFFEVAQTKLLPSLEKDNFITGHTGLEAYLSQEFCPP